MREKAQSGEQMAMAQSRGKAQQKSAPARASGMAAVFSRVRGWYAALRRGALDFTKGLFS